MPKNDTEIFIKRWYNGCIQILKYLRGGHHGRNIKKGS